MIYYSCSVIIHKSWLDNGVCGMVFIDMGLLIERMADTISAEEYGNRSSKILEDWGLLRSAFHF